MTRILKGFILIAGALYLGALAFLYVMQRDMLYPAGGTLQDPVDLGLEDVTVTALETPDGERLLAWSHPAEPGERTFLYLQGNADTLSDRPKTIGSIVNGGYGLLAISYRGFEGSTGDATQEGLILDALTAYKWLEDREAEIIIHGQSLGSGVAAQLAARVEAEALILEVPFSATVDVASERYPYFPVGLLMKDQWRTRDIIASVGEPVLIVEAGRDETIPQGHADRLYDLASEPKSKVLLPEASHTGVWDAGIWDHIAAFLEEN